MVLEVRWGELRDVAGALAGRVLLLPSRIGCGEEGAARRAVGELADVVCALGFVVGEAAAPTVPFLLELVGVPHVVCEGELPSWARCSGRGLAFVVLPGWW
ncbi:hypothetical protein [Kitasatospora sp. NPDC056800]|uniref:hypothetical protein n=1 Tax=Kitasatospora sp. NPDC056800 TaxID=3345948 RepID=UPI00369D10BA